MFIPALKQTIFPIRSKLLVYNRQHLFSVAQIEACRLYDQDQLSAGNMGLDLMAVGAHAHFIAAVTDGDGLCPEGAGLGQEQGRVGDHVVDGLAAHVVVVTVQSLSRPLQADKMGGT